MLILPSLLLLSGPALYGQVDSSRTEQETLLPDISHHLLMNTSMGEIEFALYGEEAPLTVANFIGLADSGFYDGLLFHRVHPGFLIQAGDPNTRDSTLRDKWGTGGSSIYNGPFLDELDATAPGYIRGYRRGTLAMANNGPNTNRSQFFILLTDVPGMPHNYTIFGHVVSGMNVADSIAASPLVDFDEYGGTPRSPIKILKARSVPKQVESAAPDLSDPVE